MSVALEDLMTLADAYTAATGLSESTLSGRVLRGGNRLRDLRAGKADITTRRLESAVMWFSANWPEGAVWPAGVARPDPAALPAAAEPAA